MEAVNVPQKPRVQITDVIQNTPPARIAELDFVKSKYIQNYNHCHKEKVGELMYHRQLIHFKQLISSSNDLANSDPFSLYACFVTAAANGYSLDPADNEVYLLPMKGKAYLWRQAGAHIRRLMNSCQIKSADPAKLVYEGDVFKVVNGRVLNHEENFLSDKIIAGYIRFVLDERGTDKYVIYRKSDWEAWKKKSPQAGGANWSGNQGQPDPGFLKTKIVKHAAMDKSWASGSKPIAVEEFGVEVEEPEDVAHEIVKPPIGFIPPAPQQTAHQQSAPASDDSFNGTTPHQQPVEVDDDNF